ncbi:tetratricopeptide repeat protein [Sphingomonas sp.]|uniref:tetratricopeptide repeat protein n=1 Tax=Sphingomonas sp. TaxID=28214 RepID=UPI00286D93D3|nr:tetratricopeptide repeat protein [Sphingomonas sp.]
MPAGARTQLPGEANQTYVVARAASLGGDHARSAQLFAALAEADPADRRIARRAAAEAISAGNIALALRLARRLPPDQLGIDARLLLVADELRAKRTNRIAGLLSGGANDAEASLESIELLVKSWDAAERGDATTALDTIATIPVASLIGPFVNEQRTLLLLRLKRTADAEPYARRALAAAGGRDHRLRMAFADGFAAAGDRPRALEMIDGLGTEVGRARRRLAEGRSSGLVIDTTAKAFSELLLGVAIDLNRNNSRNLPIALAQVARHAAPDNASAAVLLGVLLENAGRVDEALAVLRSVPDGNGLAAQARDAEARALADADRRDEALRLAWAEAHRPNADVSDFARLGDAFNALKRYPEAATAYGQALARTEADRPQQRWPLLLLQASALESADRWPEARRTLEAALVLAPEQPLILNFLGYAKLERGEDLDDAEAMIRKASDIAPDDASITDSLGWAQFKRGRVSEAIETLQRAALADPSQAEIHEHLGDVLFTAGRKFEARFAWQAGLIGAEDEIAARLKAKLETGLTAASAAP